MFKQFTFFILCMFFLCVYAENTENLDMYAEATSLKLSESRVTFEALDADKDLDVSVTGEDYVYSVGYLLDVKHNLWNPFQFDEEASDTGWITGSATKTLVLDREGLELITELETTSYVAAYACTKKTNWDCHNGKWMILNFNVTTRPDSCEEEKENNGTILMTENCPVIKEINDEKHNIAVSDIMDNSTGCCVAVDIENQRCITKNKDYELNGVTILVLNVTPDSDSMHYHDKCLLKIS